MQHTRQRGPLALCIWEAIMTRNLALAVTALAAVLAAPQASAQNMFYALAATWCDVGGKRLQRFQITDTGGLFYDRKKVNGPPCTMKAVDGMNQKMGDYFVTWECQANSYKPGTFDYKMDAFKEKLTTFARHYSDGSRGFFLTRKRLPDGKAETFVQCDEQWD
jgi:hypothetical protein